ncbi:GMP synthase, partial [Candidatus Micrarchaeota archaeon CG11_big_fil_rev_8_21_14_0_20_47_5]
DLGLEGKIIGKETSLNEMKNCDFLMLSGGPGSADKDNFYEIPELLKQVHSGKLFLPILGICLGHQLIAHTLDGKIGRGKNAEYGICEIEVEKEGILLQSLPKKFNAWVSHFDEVKNLPKGFDKTAHSSVCEIESMENQKCRIFGVQFHPEVWHTEGGEKILENFLGQ